MNCSKNLAITINSVSDCPDWSTLLWQNLGLFNATFSPQSTTGDSFTASTLGGVGVTQNQATISYDGAGCDCQCDITLSGDSLPNDTLCKFAVAQVAPFLSLCCFASAGAVPGNYIVTFSLPDTGGVATSFRVNVGFQSIPGSAVTTLSGTISNSP